MKPRAVFYARCSTEEESQKNALAKQVEEAEECIQKKGWILVDNYIESASGTTTKGRSEYNRLYEDLLIDKFDILVIKSQDRLMRSTKDWYLFLDRLNKAQKQLYIYIERKFYSAEDGLITGIKAILAEEYSRELSKKINNAHHNRQKNSGLVMLTHNAYGFKKMPDKSIGIIEEEAEVKRKIYRLCASGFGSRSIENILRNEGIRKRNNKTFSASDILRIIRNPMNKGTVVMNRRHYDFESKRIMKIPEEKQYIYEGKVPKTVSEELWQAANDAISERTMGRKKDDSVVGKNPGKAALSGKIYCGLCGEIYYRAYRRSYKEGDIIYEWKCKTYLEAGRKKGKYDRPQVRKAEQINMEGCDNVHINEKDFYYLLEEKCVDFYDIDKQKIIKKTIKILSDILKEKDFESDIQRLYLQENQIQNQMGKLVDKLLEGVLSDEIYQIKQRELEGQQNQIHQQIQGLEKKKADESIFVGKIRKIEEKLQSGKMIEKAAVDEMLEEISRIVVYPTYMEIYFSLSDRIGLKDQEFSQDRMENCMKIQYGNRFNYRERKKDEREIIIRRMTENPRITARILAQELGCSLSGVNYKIRALKREGRIRFHGKGGVGYWEVIK